MLRAESHELTHFIHLLEEVNIVALGTTLRLLDQTRQHRDDRRLACTIVAKQSENLAIEHLEVDATYGTEATREGLLEVVNLQVVSILLSSFASGRRAFIVLRLHLTTFKFVIAFCMMLIVVGCLVPNALPAAAAVEAGHAEEAGVEALAEARRDDLVHVESKTGENEEVEEEHPECRVE